MHPEDIKAELRKSGSSISDIARELNVSATAVSLVVRGRTVSQRIEVAIAKKLGMAPEMIFVRN